MINAPDIITWPSGKWSARLICSDSESPLTPRLDRQGDQIIIYSGYRSGKAEIWTEYWSRLSTLVAHEFPTVHPTQSIYDAGVTSLNIVESINKLSENGVNLGIVDVFDYPSPAELTAIAVERHIEND
ncbi:acyl carrier protein [Corynebacterium glyciniphilum]|uniref:acyl carrier protein n=1 Tax=Corynebacterium glyciniphilum TaxID=1404244 RepID=UPI0034E93314